MFKTVKQVTYKSIRLESIWLESGIVEILNIENVGFGKKMKIKNHNKRVPQAKYILTTNMGPKKTKISINK